MFDLTYHKHRQDHNLGRGLTPYVARQINEAGPDARAKAMPLVRKMQALTASAGRELKGFHWEAAASQIN